MMRKTSMKKTRYTPRNANVRSTLMKRTALALILIVTILAVTTIAVLFAAKPSPSSDNPDEKTLFIESFNPTTIGSNVTGGSIVLVNPTNENFENLTLKIKIDDSELIVPFLRLLKPLPVEEPFSAYSVPITQISIASNQNETVQLYLFDPDQNEPPFYETIVTVQTFSSHIIRFYITQNTFGDVINGQSLIIPQEKAYLQITGYSSIEHDNNTWHEYFNSSTNQYEYVNDQPNFYQQYYQSRFFPLDPSSYNWAKTLNQLGEHYFNVTVYNNNTFAVNGIVLNSGEGSVASALPDTVLQPDETYTFPVQVSGENWWSANSVNQLSNFFPAYSSGDLINEIKAQK
jgi:hypothetical protein